MTTYSPLSFTQTFRDGMLIVELKGAMDSALCLDAALDAADESPAKHVIVVLTCVDYINSAGFSALIRFSDVVTEGEKTLYVVGLEGSTLKVHYQGACGTCPSSISGTLAGIEGLVKRIDPEMEVVAV